VVIDWGDGTKSTLNLAAGVRAFSGVTHVFADDNPNGTPSDTPTITVTVTDDDTGATNKTQLVTINNVAPGNLTLNNATINENNSFTLTGTFTDPGVGDAHTLFIDWNGDGTFDETVNLAAGVTNISVTSPVYADDDPTASPQDPVNVKAKVSDDDLGVSGTSTATLTVKNVAPSNITLGGSPFVNEGDTFIIDGSFTDPGAQDTHTVQIY
jgi:hypothetical protein